MPLAADTILLGQLGEIHAGQEIPASYPGTLGDEVKTDFKRLKSLGLVADEKAHVTAPPKGPPSTSVASAPPATRAPRPPLEDELPDGVKDLGSGWYEVNGEKVRGRDAAVAQAAADAAARGPETAAEPQE